jgi:hypothetical protein
MSAPKAQPMYPLGEKSITKPIMQKTIMMQDKTQEQSQKVLRVPPLKMPLYLNLSLLNPFFPCPHCPLAHCRA